MNFTPIRIPFSVDLPALKEELKKLDRYFRVYSRKIQPIDDGEVRIVPLISPGGKADYFGSDPDGTPYIPTVFLKRVPAFRKLLERIPGEIMSVRLISLAPGAKLVPHKDNFRNLRAGVLRLHIPIVTNKKAFMVFSEKKYHWKEGELWLGDFAQKHSVLNNGDTTRTHLLMDFVPKRSFFRKTSRLERLAKGFNFHDMHSVRKLLSAEKKWASSEFVVPAHFLTDVTVNSPAKIVAGKGKLYLVVKNKKLLLIKVRRNTFRIAHYIPSRLIHFQDPFINFHFSGVVTKKIVTDFKIRHELIFSRK